MACRFLDGVNHYATAGLLRKWTSNGGANTATVSTPGRFGGNCILFGNNVGIEKTLDAQTTWIVGFALKSDDYPNAGDITILEIKDGINVQMDVRFSRATQTLYVTRNGTVLGTAVPVFPIGVWKYIEFKTLIDNTVGTYQLKVDGVSILSGTGADTQNTANASANRVKIYQSTTTASGTMRISDIYICDGTGGANNDFLGEVRIDTLFPSADGATLNWTPSTGTDHYALVDETSPNDDTDYNSSSTVGNIDLYEFANTALTGTIAAVGINMYVRKDDAGTRQIRSVTRRGGSNYTGSTLTVGSNYEFLTEIQQVDPSTSAAWTVSNLNGAQFGVEVVA
jgi:hypothetical protein